MPMKITLPDELIEIHKPHTLTLNIEHWGNDRFRLILYEGDSAIIDGHGATLEEAAWALETNAEEYIQDWEEFNQEETPTMNIIETLRAFIDAYASNLIFRENNSLNDAHKAAAFIIERFDSYAPRAEDWPNWASHCAIHANGLQYFFDAEPYANPGSTGWHPTGTYTDFYRQIELLPDIPWQLCIWANPSRQEQE